MIAVFTKSSNHVVSVPLLEGNPVNAEQSSNVCLPEVFEAWTACRPNNITRYPLPHHSTSAHTAAATLDLMETSRGLVT